MSPAIAATPSGSTALVAPRLKTVTRQPALAASATQGSEMFPVPPTKRTFRLIKRLLSTKIRSQRRGSATAQACRRGAQDDEPTRTRSHPLEAPVDGRGGGDADGASVQGRSARRIRLVADRLYPLWRSRLRRDRGGRKGGRRR